MSDVYRLPNYVNGTPFPSRPRSGGFRISMDDDEAEAATHEPAFTKGDFERALRKIKKEPEKRSEG